MTGSELSVDAFIPRSFLDRLCPFGDFEACDGDRDHDGIADTSDNCPDVANADQTNSNYASDPSIYGSGNYRGDACDKAPHGPLLDARISQKSVSIAQQSHYGVAFIWYQPLGDAHLDYQPSGFTTADNNGFTDEGAATTTDNINAEYCGCHDWQQSTATNPTFLTDSQCENTVCPSTGLNPRLDRDKDTGYQQLNWTIPSTSQACSLGNHDSDPDPPTKDYNECVEVVPNRTFERLYGSIKSRPALCTDSNEYKGIGCQAVDQRAFWRKSGKTRRLVWDWNSEDYPHNPQMHNGAPSYIYNPAETVHARVRIRFHPPSQQLTNNNTHTDPQTLSLSFYGYLVRPLYDPPLFRWVLPALADPLVAPLPPYLLSVVDRATPTTDVDSQFDWNIPWSDPLFATRGLIATPLFRRNGQLGNARPSEVVGGDPQQSLPTIGFSASQHDVGAFLFGGVNGSGGYTNGLWFTDLPDRFDPEGGALVVQRLAGDIGLDPIGGQSATLASGSGSSSGSKTTAGGTSSSNKTSSDPFAAFMRTHPSKYKRKRLDVLVSKALQRWQSRQKKRSGKVTSASSPTPPSFSAASPPGQAETVTGYSPDWATVTVFYGDSGTSPPSGGLVSLAIYDLVAGSWVSGTVDWSATMAGNRRYAAYAGRSGHELILYGGEADGEVSDGLYLLDLNPELLMAGAEPVQLDGGSTTSPGPRSRARIVFDPYGEGGAGAVYLFGGTDSSATVQNDLWRYSLRDGQWTLLAASQSDPNAPTAALGGGVLVRSLDGAIVVYSGAAGGGSEQQAAYLFVEGQGWQVLTWPAQ